MTTKPKSRLDKLNAELPHYGTGTPLLKVQLHCWPPQNISMGQARKLHLQLIEELRVALDPLHAKGPSCGYRPKHEVASAAADGPKCWLDSSTIRACNVEGNETVCRVDHYICDDGSWYDEEIPLAVEAAHKGDNGIAREVNADSGGQTRRSAARTRLPSGPRPRTA